VNAAAAASPSRGPVAEAPGTGIAILVNANAKRGGRRVAVQIARALPGAAVKLTRSKEEIASWLRVLPPRKGVFAAGGDGSAVALVNALARVTPPDRPLPTMGILPLGTGNGWAHALGAPKLYRCLDLLGRCPPALPVHRAGLVEVEGTLAHFAGSGWDAMILDDFRRQVAATKGPGQHLSKSVYGYLSATLLRTIPRVVRYGNPRVLVENLADEVYTLDAAGRPYRLDAKRGAILYDGPAGVAAVGTCPQFGYRFRAFPFAERLPGFINVRIFARGAISATTVIPRLWAGAHPIAGMHDWLACHVRMTFSRPVLLQVGGDSFGERRTIEYRASPRPIAMVDWRRLG
jgi:diacylglycerol kinase family enzyme